VGNAISRGIVSIQEDTAQEDTALAKKPDPTKRTQPPEGPEASEKSPPKRSAPKGDVNNRIIDAALGLTVSRHWGDIPLADIAREAGLPLGQVYASYPSKSAILSGFARRVDIAMLEGAADWAAEKPRDRLFDAIMRRFDALAPHKPALRNLLRDARAGQVPVIPAGVQFGRSMTWTLEAVGAPATGLRGAVRVRLLGVVYLTVLRTWLDDDSEDQARTMAVLDRRLRGVERWLGLSAPETAGDGKSR
jgi:AcrR family transcriptional regulator